MKYLLKGKVTINVEKIIDMDTDSVDENAKSFVLGILNQAHELYKLDEGGYADIDSAFINRSKGRFALDNNYHINWTELQEADEEDLGYHGIEPEEV